MNRHAELFERLEQRLRDSGSSGLFLCVINGRLHAGIAPFTPRGLEEYHICVRGGPNADLAGLIETMVSHKIGNESQATH